MNKTIDEMIAIMTTYKNGAEIESTFNDDNSNSWHISTNPKWNWLDLDYRVKGQIMPPDIEEIVDKKYKTRDGRYFRTKEEAKEHLIELDRPSVYLVIRCTDESSSERVVFASLNKDLASKKLEEIQIENVKDIYTPYSYSLTSYKLDKDL